VCGFARGDSSANCRTAIYAVNCWPNSIFTRLMGAEMEHEAFPIAEPTNATGRRQFVRASSLAMAAGLAGSYGTFAFMLGRFVYPAGASNRGWLFVCQVDQLAPGAAMDFATPSGQRIVVARQGQGTQAGDFLALSSVCPHLGCRVHWESNNDRFFCPCHNGAFDRQGQATAGPPKAAHQSLTRFPLKVENGLLLLEAPLASLASTDHPPTSDSTACHSQSGVV
jgi:cytochrome b6-f complex iron-sulfur subunit